MKSWVLQPKPNLFEALRKQGISSAAILDLDKLESDPAYIERRSKSEGDFSSWLDSEYAGTMDWLYRQKELKFRPRNVFPGAKSMLVVALPYGPRRSTATKPLSGGRVSAYAWGRDYHKVLAAALKKACDGIESGSVEAHPLDGPRFRILVDANPLNERFFAEEAGLGFTGRHTLIISPRHGSWVFLACVLSTIKAQDWGEIERVDSKLDRLPVAQDRCPSACRKCIDVCPTGALISENKIDARRCISYLTIEHRGSIPKDLRPLMGDWVYGCDLCQEVCPFNVAAHPGRHPDFVTLRAGRDLELADLLSLRNHDDLTRRFSGTPIMRAGWESMVRNACIAAGNKGSADLRSELEDAARCGSEIVREHALWALDSITRRES